MDNTESIKKDLERAIIDGKMHETPGITQEALDLGLAPRELMDEVLTPAMEVVGEKFEEREYYVPEVLVSARAMQACLDIIRPMLFEENEQAEATIAVGTVKGDIHEIGKGMVCMVLEGAGFNVIDLGVDVAPEKFVEVVQQNVDIIAMSSLMTTTRDYMGDTILALSEANLRQKVKVMVGGAAVTPGFAQEIGADAYGVDCNEALRIVKEMIC